MGKGSPRPKKNTDESVKDQVFFFYWKGVVHHEFVPRRSDGKQTVVPGSFSAFEGFCA